MSLSKKNYDPRIISVFEIVGCYFVDIFYNHIYINAKNTRDVGASDRGRSVTDEYKAMVRAYVRGVKSKRENYSQTIKGLHRYYQTVTKFNTISFVQFIDDVLVVFIPVEHLEVMTSTNKSDFLGNIVNDIISRFADEALSIDMLRLVIDDHQNKDNPRIWVDRIANIQISIREGIYSKFARKELGLDEKIDKNVYEELKSERNKLVEKLKQNIEAKCEIDTKYSTAKKAIEILYQEKVELEEKLRVAQAEISGLQRALELTRPAPAPTPVPKPQRKAVVAPIKVPEPKPEPEPMPEPEIAEKEVDLPQNEENSGEDVWAAAARRQMDESDSSDEEVDVTKHLEDAKNKMLAKLNNSGE